MRYLVISDIHANWDALRAVLADADGRFDEILNCGDLVGYGPDPAPVVEWTRTHRQTIVRGNHDKVCATLENLDWFNPIAAKSVEWTHKVLAPEDLDYLRGLPAGPVFVNGLQLVHGSPANEDEYLVRLVDIASAAAWLDRSIGFFGHTHIQGCYMIKVRGVKRVTLATVDLDPDAVYMINPGSVGQPRDRDPRAAWAIYDTEGRFIEMRRSEYDVGATQKKITAAGLPHSLATRLAVGR
ncbi:MAG TPA: metallophosphoesterase family protein [Bryobacteraceae bacterium]|nr:metallophosphoesterase family protein [Bryobacteraceae bacterium]